MNRLLIVALATIVLLSHARPLCAQPGERLHPDLQEFADAIVASTAGTEAEVKDRLYESLIFAFVKPSPKSIAKVAFLDRDGIEHVVWEGEELVAAKGGPAHIARVEVKTKAKTNRLKIYVNTKKVSGWIYYDAVGLIDAAGNTQWASWANSSTCYAPGDMPVRKHKLVFDLLNGSNDSSVRQR